MKLAEALIKRRDLDTAVANLNLSLQENVKVLEGTKPFEDPLAIADQMQTLIDEQAKLIQKINKTNNRTVTDDGRTLDELITLREQLKRRHKLFDSAYKHAFSNTRSYNEIKYVIAVDMQMLKTKISASAKEFRELDNKIQAINWTTELV
jgi:predicted RNA binding protein with dsRBD fold (UPF0201 family)